MARPLTPHQVLNPASLAKPSGFSHAVAAVPGKTVYLAGQTAQGKDGRIAGGSVAEQFETAAANVVAALTAAGATAEHVVSMQILTTDLVQYRSSLVEIGRAYQRHFGRHYPAVSLLGVTSLFDPAARIEIVCIAVIPEGRS